MTNNGTINKNHRYLREQKSTLVALIAFQNYNITSKITLPQDIYGHLPKNGPYHAVA